MNFTTNPINPLNLNIMKTNIQNKRLSILQISGALIWSALIITCSYVLRESEKQELVRNLLITAAGLQISLFGFFLNRVLKNRKSLSSKTGK